MRWRRTCRITCARTLDSKWIWRMIYACVEDTNLPLPTAKMRGERWTRHQFDNAVGQCAVTYDRQTNLPTLTCVSLTRKLCGCCTDSGRELCLSRLLVLTGYQKQEQRQVKFTAYFIAAHLPSSFFLSLLLLQAKQVEFKAKGIAIILAVNSTCCALGS